jgi:hypothetical protein
MLLRHCGKQYVWDENMFGTTIIAETSLDRLQAIAGVDDLVQFTCLELDCLVSLDFELILVNSGCRWAADHDPVMYDPEAGLALFKIDEAGLAAVLQLGPTLSADQAADIEKLAAFVRLHGRANLYEYATF